MGMSAVAAYLREIRIRKGISQESLAEAMKVALRTVSRWENEGTDGLRAESLFRAIDFLGASLEDVCRLMINEGASDQEAQRFADAYFTPTDYASIADLSLSELSEHEAYLNQLDDRALLQELMRRQETAARSGAARQPAGRRRPLLRPWRRGSAR
jgi:transcriptional regulator with XRE-family HTH domain